jgi:hypothetical protein
MRTLDACRKTRMTRSCRPKLGSLSSCDEIVDAYIRAFRTSAQHERQFFKGCSLKRAIEFAARCKLPSGKRHPHQYRIPRAVLVEAESILQDCADELRGCETFHDLYKLVRQEIGGIHGIGILTVYDVATRIGAHLDLAPEFVYLHAGTADGAAALGFAGRDTLDRMDLPRAFRRLRAYEVEDCLCSYKDQLKELAQKASRHR